MFENDVTNSYVELGAFHWFYSNPENVKNALVNMHFNLGLTRLLKFKKMIDALKNRDYKRAALEAMDSKWAQQVGMRAIRVSDMMRG